MLNTVVDTLLGVPPSTSTALLIIAHRPARDG